MIKTLHHYDKKHHNKFYVRIIETSTSYKVQWYKYPVSAIEVSKEKFGDLNDFVRSIEVYKLDENYHLKVTCSKCGNLP